MKAAKKRYARRIRYFLEHSGVNAVAHLVPLLPLEFWRGFADLLGSVVFRLDRRSRKTALANLEIALGEQLDASERRRIAERSFQIFGRSFLELFWTPRLTPANLHRYIRVEPAEVLRTLMDTGEPIIGATLHFGNFEWGSAAFGYSGYPGWVLTQRFKNDLLTPIFRRLRELSGHRATTQEMSMVRYLKALHRGLPVGALVDLTLRMREPAVLVRAFGRWTRVTMIHAVLHERTGRRILPFLVLPGKDQRYILRLFAPMSFPAGTSRQAIAQAVWDLFEPVIRQHPEHWLWAYKHWRYRPTDPGRAYPFYANTSEQFDQEVAVAEAAVGND